MTVPEVWKACRDEAENGRSPFGLEGEKSADRHEVMFVGHSPRAAASISSQSRFGFIDLELEAWMGKSARSFPATDIAKIEKNARVNYASHRRYSVLPN